jgi:hypothetical protein
MAHVKKTLPILLAFVLIANCILFSAAQMDDDDDEDSKETAASLQTAWKGKVCTIRNADASSYKMYMRKMSKGFRVAYKREPQKGTNWIITPVQVGEKSYFEVYNKEMKMYMGASKSQARGTTKNHEKSDTTKTLFKIDPPKQDVPVYISSFKGKFINEPTSLKKKGVAVDSKKKSKWIIKCN